MASAQQCDEGRHVLTDCCAGLSQRAEAAAFRQLEAAGAQPTGLSSFFTGLVPHLDHPVARIVFPSLARYWNW